MEFLPVVIIVAVGALLILVPGYRYFFPRGPKRIGHVQVLSRWVEYRSCYIYHVRFSLGNQELVCRVSQGEYQSLAEGVRGC